MAERALYQKKLRKLDNEFEALCKRCGSCCGAFDGDPCEHLTRKPNGEYFCPIYDCRFGPQKTKKGNEFDCVPIRELIKEGALRVECAYNNFTRR